MNTFPPPTPNPDADDDARFDDLFRRGLDDAAPAPIAGGWQRLRGQLPPPATPPLTPAPARRARLRPFGAGLLVGVLLWWGGGERRAVPSTTVATPGSTVATPSVTGATPSVTVATPGSTVAMPSVTVATRPVTGATPSVTVATRPVTGATPSVTVATPSVTGATIRWAGVERRDSLLQQESRAYFAPLTQAADTARPARLRALIGAQTRALATLQARLDSVKRLLPEAPPALAAVADSAARPVQPMERPPSRWAVVGLLETTPSWSVLPTAAPGVDQEQTQASLAQSAQVQYDAGSRWRLRAGLGQATLHTQGRYVSERTTSTVVSDTDRTTTIQVFVKTREVDIVEIGSTDTIHTLLQFLDTVRTNTVAVRQRTEVERRQLQQLLRPEYRFWTLPLSAQYLLVQRPRWSLGLSVGGQVAVFRGGSVPVWTGDAYALRPQSARQGPYRPISLSLSAGLEVQYRLNDRLSALLAPTVRGWVVPPGRNRTADRPLLPAVQVGLSYGF